MDLEVMKNDRRHEDYKIGYAIYDQLNDHGS